MSELISSNTQTKHNPLLPSQYDWTDLPDLVAAQAAAIPEQLALGGGAESLSYGELEHNASRLAAYLRSLGVGVDVAVGICMDRSIWAVVGALAVLKAGGAYVPIDLSYPRDRISFMLSDAQVAAVLTNERSAASLPSGTRQQVIVDRDRLGTSPHSSQPVQRPSRSEDLAYIIYTSGSTGQPKGVEISRGSLLNLLQWHQEAFQITHKDRASQVASFSFDAAVWEIWPYLTSGASVQIADEQTRKDPYLLRDWLLAQRITVSFVPTGLVEPLLRLGWPTSTELRMVLTGGDTLGRHPSAHLPFLLVNNYGPTEATVVATSGPVLGNGHQELPNIGQPIRNTDVYILDENLNQVPSGSTGEIFIGGAGLARGYHNRPDLTAEKFVRNPFCPGTRLYRTGDLARYLPDGSIAFSGRVDEQVKIRGYRIELTEIGVVLNRHEAIRDSIVVAREKSGGDKELVAYIVPAKSPNPTDRALRSFLNQSLPDHMIPSVFVCLPSIPLGVNGKIDRASLPAPTRENTLSYEPFVPANTAVEERVIEILRLLLNVQQVGINDNFFLMGGHSLLGAQLLARVRDSFGVELSLRTLFDRPRVADISLEIERLLLSKPESESVA
jgi:amino acid adenylation domain-containing protein